MTNCSSDVPKNPTNQTNENTDTTKKNTNNNLATSVKTPEPTVNDAPTVGPVFKAYCDAMTKKDEAALKKVYSQDTLKYFAERMKEEKVKTLVAYLENEQVSNKLCEVRNEKIEGNTATAEVRTEGAPNGFKVLFVKENNEWKLTNKVPDFERVKETSSNSNAGK